MCPIHACLTNVGDTKGIKEAVLTSFPSTSESGQALPVVPSFSGLCLSFFLPSFIRLSSMLPYFFFVLLLFDRNNYLNAVVSGRQRRLGDMDQRYEVR